MARGNPDLKAVEQAEAFAEEQAKGEEWLHANEYVI